MVLGLDQVQVRVHKMRSGAGAGLLNFHIYLYGTGSKYTMDPNPTCFICMHQQKIKPH